MSSESAWKSGQSHLNHASENPLEIGIVPASFESLGLDAYARGVFLTQQIETNVPEYSQIFIGMAESYA